MSEREAHAAWETAQDHYLKLVRLHDPEVVEEGACPDLIAAESAVWRAYHRWMASALK